MTLRAVGAHKESCGRWPFQPSPSSCSAAPGVQHIQDTRDLDAGSGRDRAVRPDGGHKQLALDQILGPPCGGVRQPQGGKASQVRILGCNAGSQPCGILFERNGGASGHLAVNNRQAAVDGAVEPVVGPLGWGDLPDQGVRRQPVGAGFGTQRIGRVVSEGVAGVVVGERHGSARRVEEDVAATGYSACAVVLVPGVVESNLHAEAPGRDIEGGPVEGCGSLHRQQPAGGALRLPVSGAADFGLQRSYERHSRRPGGVVGKRREGKASQCQGSD